MRRILGRFGFSGVVLVVAALALLIEPAMRQLQQGWFTHGDAFFVGAAAVLLAAAFSPPVLRINVAVFVGLLVGLELFALIALAWRPSDKVVVLDPDSRTPMAEGHIRRDPELGYVLARNSRVLVLHTSDDKVVYEMRVTTDSLGRRLVPLDDRTAAERFVMFFGDSFSFGDGVNDDETFPYHVGRRLPDVAVYNYGLSGYGPQHAVAVIESRSLRSEVPQKRGVALYTYIDAHVHRAALTSRSGASLHSPYYVIDADGELRRHESLRQARPVLFHFLNDILPRSYLYRWLRLDLPIVGEEAIELTCSLLAASRQKFLKQFEGSEFFVVFYPQRGSRYAQRVKGCLERRGVPFLDLSNEPWPDEYLIHYDGHPNSVGHRKYADLLVPALEAAMPQPAR